MKTLTPAMAQFYELKKSNQDSILWFRMGDFYEMFDDDAHIAHKVL
jgi:DNA mismatch repair protein MutS